MKVMPVSAEYRADPLFAQLGSEFADPVAPARFPRHALRRRNQAWAAQVGLGDLSETEWEDAFARFAPLPDNQREPLAMRYHGHQFRAYNPDIGDGRGFLYAQLRDARGRLLDLGTKGSGQTPYSRFGDGRLTLKGGVREVLAAELLEALGVNTSKAFALYETGEALTRHDEPSPTRSSVLTRLSHSHIRIGTFQRLAYFERADLMHQLTEHVCSIYYPELADLNAEARAIGLMREVTNASARLAGQWMAAGFVHGVLNSDNLNITGESFDYGPWRFLPTSQPGFTAAYFDENRLYAFARQPEAVSWNLAQLAGALSLAAPIEPLIKELEGFAPAYHHGLREAVFARLGIETGALEADMAFMQALFGWMTESQIGWEQLFHDWRGGAASETRAAEGPMAKLYQESAFGEVRAGLEARTSSDAATLVADPYFERPTPVTMLIEEVEAIWAPIAERDDWSLFEAKLADIEQLKAALSIAKPS